MNPGRGDPRSGLTLTELGRATQQFEWTEDDEESIRVLKSGGALGIFMILAYLIYDFHVRGKDAPGTGVHWMILAGICLFFGLVWTRAFKRFWKFWTLLFCNYLMAMFVVISFFTRDPESRFITVMLCPLATAAFVTWSTQWQFAMATSAIIIYSAGQYLVPIDSQFMAYRSMGVVSAVIFAQFTSIFINRYRRRLRGQVQDLEEAARFRQNQIATMAHDIRSPVAALSGYASLLDESDVGPRERTDLLARIGSTAWNMDLVVSNLLDFYQVEEQDIVPAPVELDPNQVLREVALDCAMQARRRRLNLQTHFSQLPRCRLDPRQLDRIVRNMLAFAIGRMASGDIVLRSAVHSNRIVIDVTDGGAALSPAELKSLFEAPTRDGRTGPARALGLYIARAMAEAVGGRVEARYAVGRGITLIAELPLEASEPQSRTP